MSPQSLKAAIERILKPFLTDEAMKAFVSGVVSADETGAIDDGQYGDPLRDTRPEFIQKDDAGWQ